MEAVDSSAVAGNRDDGVAAVGGSCSRSRSRGDDGGGVDDDNQVK